MQPGIDCLNPGTELCFFDRIIQIVICLEKGNINEQRILLQQKHEFLENILAFNDILSNCGNCHDNSLVKQNVHSGFSLSENNFATGRNASLAMPREGLSLPSPEF